MPFLRSKKGGRFLNEKYEVTQLLNNNAVFARGIFSSQEVILVQQGVGFHHRNEYISDSPELQIFTPQTDTERKRLKQFIEEIPFEYTQFAINTISLAEQRLNVSFSDSLVFTLADHISFAVERYKKNENFNYLENEEIKQFFPDIYKFSKKTVKQINKKFDVSLEESEAISITFHFINSLIINQETNQTDILDTRKAFDITSDIVKIIEDHYLSKIDRKSISYSRLIVHIRYFVTKILHGESSNDDLLDVNKVEKLSTSFSDKKIEEINKDIATYLKQKLNYNITTTDKLFLSIHLTRQRIKITKES